MLIWLELDSSHLDSGWRVRAGDWNKCSRFRQHFLEVVIGGLVLP